MIEKACLDSVKQAVKGMGLGSLVEGVVLRIGGKQLIQGGHRIQSGASAGQTPPEGPETVANSQAIPNIPKDRLPQRAEAVETLPIHPFHIALLSRRAGIHIV